MNKIFKILSFVFISFFFLSNLYSQEDIKEKNYNKNRKELVADVYKKDSKIKSIEISDGNELVSLTLLDKSGRVIEFTTGSKQEDNFTKTVFKYDTMLVSETKFNFDGKEISKTIYTYDSAQRLAEKSTKYTRNNITEKEVFKYDDKGNLTEHVAIDKDRKEEFKQIYEYSSKGEKTIEKKYSSGKLVSAVIYFYDKDSRLFKSISRTNENENNFSEQYLYEYSSEGNLFY